jgi:hypothetical protein
MTFSQLMHKPTAYCPVGMSMLALFVVLIAVAVGATASVAPDGRPDEGPAAHICQMLIVAQLPIMAAFSWRWARGSAKGAAQVLMLQIVSLVLALAPVFIFRL